jgi:hypothetical protein
VLEILGMNNVNDYRRHYSAYYRGSKLKPQRYWLVLYA